MKQMNITKKIANIDIEAYIVFGLATLFCLAALATTVQNIYFVYGVWILFGLWIIGIGTIPLFDFNDLYKTLNKEKKNEGKC